MSLYPDTEPAGTDSELRRSLLKAGLAGALFSLSTPVAWAAAKKPDRKLINLLRKQTGLSEHFIASAIHEARFDASVIKRMETPYESRPYAEYRPLFVNDALAKLGRAYIEEHRAIFKSAHQRYGVQPEIIAAILGMETRYGRYKAKDRVLDALYTLASGYPRRADFFRNELGEYLLLCHEENVDPLSVKGSYAGAFGTTQFIPSSYRSYAVDADKDGKRNVWSSPTDIIHSVAHYFSRHHWDDTRPVAHWLKQVPHNAFFRELQKQETREWHSLDELNRHGLATMPAPWKTSDEVSLIRRETSQGTRTALVHRNFYVITRWNRSYNYAMAATELAHMLGCPLCEVEA
jgi:membrane-bound lytic murein transglycosylase B